MTRAMVRRRLAGIAHGLRGAIEVAGEVEMRVVVRRARLDEIIDLRHAVLRAGLPREEAIFEGDEAAETRHFAAVDGGEIVACLTFHCSSYEGSPAWQLRGMAVAARRRATGAGRDLLTYAEADVLRESPIRLFWCNARTPALGFYRKLGWAPVGEQFEIPTAGPHFRMMKRVPLS